MYIASPGTIVTDIDRLVFWGFETQDIELLDQLRLCKYLQRGGIPGC